MKRSSFLLAVLPFLICAMMFSVGFSTWTLAAPVEESTETSFSISVDEVHKTNEFITVTAMEMFGYSSLHFVDSEGNPSDTGSIVVTCEVKIDNCKKEMGDAWNGQLDVRIDLLYSNLCLGDGESYELFAPLSNGFKKDVSAYLRVGETRTAVSIQNEGSFVYAQATVSPGVSATGTYSFGLEFVFDIPMNKPETSVPSNFRQVFGKYLKNKTGDVTDFIATARVLSTE